MKFRFPTIATHFATVLIAVGACGEFGATSADSAGAYDGSAASGGYRGEGGNLDVTTGVGEGGEQADYTFAQHCGAGCMPGTGQLASCTVEQSGGGGGGGGQAPGSSEGDCRLGLDETSKIEGQCALPGEEQEGASCLSSANCGPGLGCVQGACRAYCCGDLEACREDTYCALRPLTSNTTAKDGNPVEEPPLIPACVPVTDCELLNDSETCPAEQTCTVVRADGTTSCVIPGDGEAGAACPCAPGHVCNIAANECLKLCRADRPDDCAEGLSCFGGGGPYPPGFGVCVSER